MRERNLYFDFLKGLAIMMVVAIHTMPIVKGFDSFGEVLTISVRLILNCAVPLFLALSGFFMARKTYSGRKDILAFWKKQIPRVYIPMLVSGLGWFVLALWQAPNGLGLVKNLLLLFSGGF